MEWNIFKSENLVVKKLSPKYILAVIDKWKNKGWYPENVILKAVKGMLPKNKLGKSIIKKLKVFQGPNHDHESQQPTEWNPN